MKKIFILTVIATVMFGCSGESLSSEYKVVDKTSDGKEYVEINELISNMFSDYLSYSYVATLESIDIIAEKQAPDHQNIGYNYIYTYDSNSGIVKEESTAVWGSDASGNRVDTETSYYDINDDILYFVYGDVENNGNYDSTPFLTPIGPSERIITLLNNYIDIIEFDVEFSKNEVIYTVTNMLEICNLSYSSYGEVQGWEETSSGDGIDNDSPNNKEITITDDKMIGVRGDVCLESNLEITFDLDYNILSITEESKLDYGMSREESIYEDYLVIEFKEQDEISIPDNWDHSN